MTWRCPLGSTGILWACWRAELYGRGAVNYVTQRVAVLSAVSPSPLPDVGGTRCHHPHFACEDFIAELTLRRLLYVRQHFDIQSVTYDWVHTVLQHGVMNTEIQGLLAWCSDLGITRETIRTFLKDETWIFPSTTTRLQKQLHRLFDVHRVSKDKPDKIRGTCSELMGVYGMLRLTFGI